MTVHQMRRLAAEHYQQAENCKRYATISRVNREMGDYYSARAGAAKKESEVNSDTD